MADKRVLLAAPRGYCAGVDRAVIAVEKALEQYGAPAYMEWFSAMGLMVTLVWIYLEILRLLSRLRE